MIPFKARHTALQKIAGMHGDLELSVRHKDILRASVTRHFESCFRPGGMHELMPTRYCYNPDIAMVGRKDKSGAWISRAFVKFVGQNVYEDKPTLLIHRVYGNGLSIDDVIGRLRSVANVRRTLWDFY